MTRYLLVVAALLLTSLGGIAAAAEEKIEHRSKSAQKVIATLEMFGINSKEVTSFIADADKDVDKGYYYFLKQDPGIVKGQISVRYHLQATPGIRRFELYYSDPGSNVEFHARTDDIRISYRLEF